MKALELAASETIDWRKIAISLFDTRQSVFARPGHLRCSPIPAMQPIPATGRKLL